MPRGRRPAKTEREWWAMLKSEDTTFIRSMKDWEAALADPNRNPLKGCSDKAIRHFTANLKFEKGGIGHAGYALVAKELNYFRFKALWAAFGLSMDLFADHESKECSKPGTCSSHLTSICTSNC